MYNKCPEFVNKNILCKCLFFSSDEEDLRAEQLLLKVLQKGYGTYLETFDGESL